MRHRRSALLVMSWLDVLCADGPALAQKREPAAVIVSPEKNGTVVRFDEVEGRLNTQGWPIVLGKPRGDDWWIQPAVEEVKNGRFRVPAFFGNDKPKEGTWFQVVIIVAKDMEEAYREYPTGTTLQALPPGLPRSATITVTLKRD